MPALMTIISLLTSQDKANLESSTNKPLPCLASSLFALSIGPLIMTGVSSAPEPYHIKLSPTSLFCQESIKTCLCILLSTPGTVYPLVESFPVSITSASFTSLRASMPLSPTTRLRKLSLECDSALARDQRRMAARRPSPPMSDPEELSEVSDVEVEEEEDDEEMDVVSSPTGLKYNISRLSPRARETVRSLYNQAPAQDPPQISLELCGIRRDDTGGSGGLFYAFQMHEVVPCAVRIGARDSQRFPTPKCECPDARRRQGAPCKHLIWLFDKISKQTLFDHDPDVELTLNEYGYAEELGDPFDRISQVRLDILADDLHCDTSDPDSDDSPPNRARIREAREIVAAVAGKQLSELDQYRPDLETSYSRGRLIRRGDPEGTLFSFILASDSLAEWFRSELLPFEPAVDPFRSIRHRVSRIIDELEVFSAAELDPDLAALYRRRGKAAEGPRDLDWAVTQIQHCVQRIEKLVSRCSRPLAAWARSSAARSLVGILKAVVGHRDLYARLIGDQDTDFVHSALDMLVDQSQFIEELEGIMESIATQGGRVSYVNNMRNLITRMRSHTSRGASIASGSATFSTETPPLTDTPTSAPAVQNPGPSSFRSVRFLPPETPETAMGRGSARTETPPLTGTPPPATQGPGSNSPASTGHFVTPGTPASAMGRGDQSARIGRGRGRGNSGRGSKRPGSRGGAHDTGGSNKRARGSSS